jgi:type IV fimbrial biogenesis protein FimT
MQRTAAGFTMLELLIALVIVAVLLGIALPAFSSAQDATRMGTARTQLISSLHTSITRATVTGRRVVLCPSADGAHCTGGTDWSIGWIGFHDNNKNRERDADESLVGSWPALAGQVHITTTNGRPKFVIQGHGGNAGSNITFTMCDRRGPAKAQTVVLNNQGRIRYGKATAEAAARTCPG